MKKSVFAGYLLIAAWSAPGSTPPAPVAWNDVQRAQPVMGLRTEHYLARDEHGKPWDFSDGSRENFTHFGAGLDEVGVSDGRLHFVVREEEGVLGWGNHDGQQAPSEVITLWPGWNRIVIRARQSGESSFWKMNLSRSGWMCGELVKRPGPRRGDVGNMEPRGFARLEGTEWQELVFDVGLPGADGFELVIETEPGNRIEIEGLDSKVLDYSLDMRHAFLLPDQPVWRAPVWMPEGMELWVNGQPVPVGGFPDPQAHAVIDIAPWLAPGRTNVIAGRMAAEPPPRAPGLIPREGQPRGFAHMRPLSGYLQGAVILRDGSRVKLDTGSAWSTGHGAVEAYSRPDFEAREWRPAEVASGGLPPPQRNWLYRSWGLPVYDGLLYFENPRDPKFFFTDEDAARVHVHVPAGLVGSAPSVVWTLRRMTGEYREEFVRQAETGSFTPGDLALVFELDLGRLDRGVYTLEAGLYTEGRLLEQRPREPLVVVGRLPMGESAAEAFPDDLDLTLELEIDFTEPVEDRLTVETGMTRTERANWVRGTTAAVDTPRIVERHGLRYRETELGHSAMFSYAFEFEHPGEFYMFELHVPEDGERAIGLAVTAADYGYDEPGQGHTLMSPTILTGGKFPLRHVMATHYSFMVGQSGRNTLDIVNLHPRERAAAARVRVYRVGNLPALTAGTRNERMIGLHTERSYQFTKTFHHDHPGFNGERFAALGLDLVQQRAAWLHWMLGASEQYTRYLRFTGQNLHAMGLYQYTKQVGAFARHERMPTVQVPRHVADVLLRVFGQNDISMLALIEFAGSERLRREFVPSDDDVADGEDTVYPVSKDGAQGRWLQNINHPRVVEDYLALIDDLAHAYASQPAWKGIYVMGAAGFSGPALQVQGRRGSDPLEFDYSDATIARFEAETGLHVPGDAQGVERFAARHAFLTGPEHRDAWIAWRMRNVADHLRATADLLHEYRPDLHVYYGEYIYPSFLEDWQRSGESFEVFFPAYGFEPRVLNTLAGVSSGRYLYPNDRGAMTRPAGHPDARAYPLMWPHYFGEDSIAAYAGQERRFTVLNTGWHEVSTSAPGVTGLFGREGELDPPDWPWRFSRSRFISQWPGDRSIELHNAALVGADAETILFGFTDMVVLNGNEEALRRFNRAFRPLPRAKFTPAAGTDGFGHNLALREHREEATGDYWFYAANPGYWTLDAEVVLDGDVTVHDAADDRLVSVTREQGRTRVAFRLPPYGVRSFRVPGGSAILGWSNAPLSAEDLAHLEQLIHGADRLKREGYMEADALPVRDRLDRASTALREGRYAESWSLLTDGQFWTLRIEAERRAAEAVLKRPSDSGGRRLRPASGAIDPADH